MTDPIVYYGARRGSFAAGQLPVPRTTADARRWRIEGNGLAPVPILGRSAITPTGVILDAERFLLVAVASAGGSYFVTRSSAGVTASCAAPVGPVLLASYAPVEFMEIATERLSGTLPANATTAQAIALFEVLVTKSVSRSGWGWVAL